MENSFHKELNKLAQKYDIDEISLTVRQSTGEEYDAYYYCNLDYETYQFGRIGDMPTTYAT